MNPNENSKLDEVIPAYESLKANNPVISTFKELEEANNIYSELIEVRKQLAIAEANFRKLFSR